VGQPKELIIGVQAFHGLAYVLFMIVGQIFAKEVAPEAIRGSMQGLIFAATTGVGLFFGSQLAGVVMDQFSVEGQFQWRKIWAVPLAILLVATIVLAALFKGEIPEEETKPAEQVSQVTIRAS
jgi:MFS family permease